MLSCSFWHGTDTLRCALDITRSIINTEDVAKICGDVENVIWGKPHRHDDDATSVAALDTEFIEIGTTSYGVNLVYHNIVQNAMQSRMPYVLSAALQTVMALS